MLVSFEGAAGVGKTTQAKLLCAKLKKNNVRFCGPYAFPQHADTFAGYRLQKFMSGEYGELLDNHPFLVSLLFSLDHYESRDLLQQLKSFTGVAVVDKYIYANMAYQAAAVRSYEERQHTLKDIYAVEFDIFNQPQADVVILLKLPADIASTRITPKTLKSDSRFSDYAGDLREIDRHYQQDVGAVYLQMADSMPSWHVVECVEGSCELDEEEIHKKVWAIITSQYRGITEELQNV